MECGQQDLTVSMGLVWADAKVPQREALQHARDAEASAKVRGKDRFALRLLYANGNHLEWTCPWEWLSLILTSYRDREGRQGPGAKWRHLAEDLLWLQSRQAIAAASGVENSRQAEAPVDRTTAGYLTTAQALWAAYFPRLELPPQPQRQPSNPEDDPPFRASQDQPENGRRFDEWLLDLGCVMAGLEKHRPASVKGAQS
jgi:CRISPR-associated protein Cmr2